MFGALVETALDRDVGQLKCHQRNYSAWYPPCHLGVPFRDLRLHVLAHSRKHVPLPFS